MDASDYFESYENLSVHSIMLNDHVRNLKYRDAIRDNTSLIKGKTVLEVGAGTGILSVYCAQAGAAKVYAVEASSVYKIAQEIVKENNYEHIIQVIHSRVEDLVLPDKVDIIISEWMGFYLFHEGMLDSVIYARDKYLKPGGLMFPENAILYAMPCQVPSMFSSWDSVNGVSMKAFAKALRHQACNEPVITEVEAEHMLDEGEPVIWINMTEVTTEDIANIKITHVAVANKKDKYQGICLWFTCTFPSHMTEPVVLSTSPCDPKTHWKQTVIILPEEEVVEEGAPIAYELCLSRDIKRERKYKIELTMLDPDDVEHPECCRCHMTKCILVRAMLERYENEKPED